MKKAVLSNRIFMVVTPMLRKALDAKLTYTIEGFDAPTILRTLKVLNDNVDGKGNLLVSLPIGRLDLIPKDYEIVDKRNLAPIDINDQYGKKFSVFNAKLRPSQQEIHDDIEDNAQINAKPGYGKTFLALAIASKLKQKTLVVVHTVDLRLQWEAEIVKVFGFKPSVIGSGKKEFDKPIVVANIQTLRDPKVMKHVCKMFGTLILDEMHHVASPTFSDVVDKINTRYKIGLSATLKRKDGKHVLFKDYIGGTIYIPDKENTMTPEVHVWQPGIELPQASNWAERVNKLLYSASYVEYIRDLADAYTTLGHKVLVVADRVDFLKAGAAVSNSRARTYLGKDKEYNEETKHLILNDLADQIWATQSMFSEGISVNPLSCIIFATPLNNEVLLEQLVGRIIREYPGKLTPIAVDIKLAGYTGNAQYNTRMGFYLKEGYKITYK